MDALSSLIVHVDNSPACAARLRTAADLARRFGAALRGVYAVRALATQVLTSPVMAGELVAEMIRVDDERRARARAAFEAATAGLQPAARWSAPFGEPQPVVAHEAWLADALVLGQHDPDSPAGLDVPADFVPGTVIASGRPALVLPHAPAVTGVGNVALVAWKPSREAAHAVTTALPLLRGCVRVNVALWREPGQPEPDATGILGYLALHGVRAEAHVYGDQHAGVGEHLLSLASDFGADLLVMGCYGHGRAREWALGGVSRTVLGAMTLPVWMAH